MTHLRNPPAGTSPTSSAPFAKRIGARSQVRPQAKRAANSSRKVVGFGKVIPDLAWNIKEVLVDGDRIIPRSEASATPVGELFGVPPGGKSFKIMTIDIHTVRDGKLALVYHVEDRAVHCGNSRRAKHRFWNSSYSPCRTAHQ
jgi:predicted ester cyclase